MTPEEIKTICRRAFEEGIGKRDLDSIDELYSLEMAENAKNGSAFWHAVAPDLQYTVEDVIVEGDRAVLFWTCISTHTRELWGIAPTGKRRKSSGIVVYRVEGGKIVEWNGIWDALGYLSELGAIPQMIVDARKSS